MSSTLLDRVWFETHQDYRGEVEGRPAILARRAGRTVLVPLDDLTAREVRSRLPARGTPLDYQEQEPS